MFILIVTIQGDLHGLCVQDALRRRGVECHIIETDSLTDSENVHFCIDNLQNVLEFRSNEGCLIDPSRAGLIWWRRPKALQRKSISNDDHRNLINNNCSTALTGSLQTVFRGKWISDPQATDRASNKLVQLKAARQAGFRIPATLVTQIPSKVKNFYDEYHGKIIVKPVSSIAGPLLFTQFVKKEHIRNEESIRICPATYQEYIDGNRHIRLNCFGSNSYAAIIESNDLDWRPNLNVPIIPWTVSSDLHARVRKTLDILGLEMGIVDLKESSSGEVVWFEVNPQGQFLFLEGLTQEPLTDYFSDYLAKELETISMGSNTTSIN